MSEKTQLLFFSEVFILHVSANLLVSVFIPRARMQRSLDSGPRSPTLDEGRLDLVAPGCKRRPFHLTAVMSPGVARTHNLHI